MSTQSTLPKGISTPDWEERYATGETPWDTGKPDRWLVAMVDRAAPRVGRAIEVGCGTGTNALWLAERGFEVVGVDLSVRAIDAARERLAEADPATRERCRFEACDFLEGASPLGPFDFAFDRGCFHCFDDVAQQALFAKRVAELLAGGGRWLSVIGSTEGPAREHGPPRRSIRDIAAAIEPHLELLELRSETFDAELPSLARAWLCLAGKRDVPAQPSTLRK